MLTVNNEIYTKLDSIKNLPAIPEIMFEAISTLKSDPGNVLKLAEIIGKDQGMVTKILSVANSPLYGMLRKVNDLEFAIMIMGSNELENIITAISLSNAVNFKSVNYFSEKEYWQHSMAVGLIAKSMARKLGMLEISGEAFVGGILHDIGIQLSAKYFSKEFQLVFENNNNNSYYESEEKIIGINHQELGAYLLNKWELPTSLVNCIKYHHIPSSADDKKELVALIHFADIMANDFGNSKAKWDEGNKLDYSISEILGFENIQELENFKLDYLEDFTDTISLMKI